MTFSQIYMQEVAKIAGNLDCDQIERMAYALHTVREQKGRVFFLGFGGSFANAEHAAADFRKLCEIDASAPNVAEMSAWWNDSGEAEAFSGALQFAKPGDAIVVLSVGGGTSEVSRGLSVAVEKMKALGVIVLGIVGPEGGFTARNGDVVVRVPASGLMITPHTEAFQAVIWHALVSHPLLQRRATKW